MCISADQSRAGSGLLNWRQEQLAENARVSRATIADFENNSRLPLTNNLRSISDCMFAAGVEFLREEGTSGVGVRFRERKLEYINSVRVDRFNRRATIRMKYANTDFLCQIPCEVIDDYHRSNFDSDGAYAAAVGEMLHLILAAVEKRCSNGPPEKVLTVSFDMLS